MNARQSSLYFEIKNFKYIHVQKNIKVEEFIVNVHCKKVDGP